MRCGRVGDGKHGKTSGGKHVGVDGTCGTLSFCSVSWLLQTSFLT